MSTSESIELKKKLSDEDQAKVDAFLARGVNSVERKPFKPFLLLLILAIVVVGIGKGAWLIGKLAGIEA